MSFFNSTNSTERIISKLFRSGVALTLWWSLNADGRWAFGETTF